MGIIILTIALIGAALVVFEPKIDKADGDLLLWYNNNQHHRTHITLFKKEWL